MLGCSWCVVVVVVVVVVGVVVVVVGVVVGVVGGGGGSVVGVVGVALVRDVTIRLIVVVHIPTITAQALHMVFGMHSWLCIYVLRLGRYSVYGV